MHVSEVEISLQTGMGRVEYYWKQAFEKQGYQFVHIGPKEVEKIPHKALFSYKAYQYYKKLKVEPTAFIVHEPASHYFVKRGIPCFLESHGVERRAWENNFNGSMPREFNKNISLKTRLLFPIWRLRGCDNGLKHADKLLLINNDDKDFVLTKYQRKEKDIFLFHNGISKTRNITNHSISDKFIILFNGSWIQRKGIHTLIEAAKLLYIKKLDIHYLLIGTGAQTDTVLLDWPQYLRAYVTVIPTFTSEQEIEFLSSSSLFVLPSFYEGQPLSLLQAMASAKCCITTNCCGQKDIIKNGQTGFLFNAGDFLELSRLIANCYQNIKLIQEIGNNSFDYVNTYTWEAVSKQVVDYVCTHTANVQQSICES